MLLDKLGHPIWTNWCSIAFAIR